MDQDILDAFQTMWGLFPEPVMLIHKARTILARDDFAQSVGVPTGIKCFSLNPEAATATCGQCKSNLALREQRAVCTDQIENGNRVIGYWMPLKQLKDAYVHFDVGVAAAVGWQPGQPTPSVELVNLSPASQTL